MCRRKFSILLAKPFASISCGGLVAGKKKNNFSSAIVKQCSVARCYRQFSFHVFQHPNLCDCDCEWERMLFLPHLTIYHQFWCPRWACEWDKITKWRKKKSENEVKSSNVSVKTICNIISPLILCCAAVVIGSRWRKKKEKPLRILFKCLCTLLSGLNTNWCSTQSNL